MADSIADRSPSGRASGSPDPLAAGRTQTEPRLEVEFTTVTPVSQSPLFGKTPSSVKSHIDGIATDYRIKSYFYGDYHRYMMGVTAKGAGPAIIQLAEKTLMWVCDWTAAKLGAHPEIPNPAPKTISKWILANDHFVPASIMATQDGANPLYRISGTYVYLCASPSNNTLDDVSFPIGAWLKATFFDRTIKKKHINSDLLELSQGQANGQNDQGGNQQVRG